MSSRQITLADANECVARMNGSQRAVFAAATQEQKMQMLLRSLSAVMPSPISTESSQPLFDNDGDDVDEEYLRTPTSPTSSNDQARPKYVCLHTGCARAFYRHGDLQRHLEGKHNPNRERFDCPVDGCNRIGIHGLPRKDKVLDHMRDKHKIQLPKLRKGEGRGRNQAFPSGSWC